MNRSRLAWVVLLIVFPYGFLFPQSHYALAKVIYIDKNATGDQSGTDWENACTTITAGLTLSASGDQVWVKSATYEEAITMVEGVALYGGFPSDGSPEMGDRDWEGNETVVDASGLGTHAVVGANNAILGGFTITGGSVAEGGGIYCSQTSPTIANCLIAGNSADDGAGVYVREASPTLRNCTIVDSRWMGLSCWGGASPTVIDCTFARNFHAGVVCKDGSAPSFMRCALVENTGRGILSSDASPILIGCSFDRNSVEGVACWGGSLNLINCSINENSGSGLSFEDSSSAVITDCTISRNGLNGFVCTKNASVEINRCRIQGNRTGVVLSVGVAAELSGCKIQGNQTGGTLCVDSTATLSLCEITYNGAHIGGAIMCRRSSLTVINCTIARNSATSAAGGLVCENSSATLLNCILWNRGKEIAGNAAINATVEYCAIQMGWPGEGNFDAAPLFQDCAEGDWGLRNGSPCIDGGTDVGLNFNGSAPDVGARESPSHYERGPTEHIPRIVYVDAGVGTEGDGSTWEEAFASVTCALDIVSASDQVWVKKGVYFQSVIMEEMVELYGGFAGSESTPEDRDWESNPSVVDATGLRTSAIIGADEAVLDGFIVTGGEAQLGGGVCCYGSSPTLREVTITGNIADMGGGFFCSGGLPRLLSCKISGNEARDFGGGVFFQASPTALEQCEIVGNRSRGSGGGVCGRGGSLTLTGCSVLNSVADVDGGGMYFHKAGNARITLISCLVNNNDAGGRGGGVCCVDGYSIEAVDCEISRNVSGLGGGGIWQNVRSIMLDRCHIRANSASGSGDDGRGGGIYFTGEHFTFTGCRIEDNSCTGDGGGIFCSGDELSGAERCFIICNTARGSAGAMYFIRPVGERRDPFLFQCTIFGNHSGTGSGGLYSDRSLVSITNSILWNSGIEMAWSGGDPFSVIHSCVQGGRRGDGNSDAWPLFVDPSSRDYRLQDGSPCVDGGIYTGDAYNGAAPDMGAWEAPAEFVSGNREHIPRVVYLAADASENGDGSSWERAIRSIDEAFAITSTGDEVWAKAGIYQGVLSVEPTLGVYGGFSGTEAEIGDRNLVMNQSVIDAAGRHETAAMVPPGSVLDGFAITGGDGAMGGGVHCDGCTLRNCSIYDNWATEGGGVYASGPALIQACTITGNSATNGGGLAGERDSPLAMEQCIILGNWAEYGGGVHLPDQGILVGCAIVANSAVSGGGLYVVGDYSGWDGTFRNCTVVGNSADAGGAVFCYPGGKSRFRNCTIAANSPDGIYGYSYWGYCLGPDWSLFPCLKQSYVEIDDCIVWGHGGITGSYGRWSDANFSDLSEEWLGDGEGNIDATPEFVHPWDGEWGNFRLKRTSPCIDGGNPYPGCNDACQPPGKGSVISDMGAYGGPYNCQGPPDIPWPEGRPTHTVTPTPSITPTPSVTPTPSSTPTFTLTPTDTATPSPTSTPSPHPNDLTGDGFLDAEDLFFFSLWWQQPTNETSYPCDFVPDGVINETDLLTLYRAW